MVRKLQMEKMDENLLVYLNASKIFKVFVDNGIFQSPIRHCWRDPGALYTQLA